MWGKKEAPLINALALNTRELISEKGVKTQLGPPPEHLRGSMEIGLITLAGEVAQQSCSGMPTCLLLLCQGPCSSDSSCTLIPGL